MGTTKIFHICSDTLLCPIDSIAQGIEKLKNGGILWIDITNPTPEDFTSLAGNFDLHPLAIEDCCDSSVSLPKIESFGSNIFAIFHYLNYEKNELGISEVSFFISHNFLITVHGIKDNDQLFSSFFSVLERCRDKAVKGTDYLMHLFVDYVIDKTIDVIEKLQDKIETCEERVIKEESETISEELFHIRHCLVSIRKSLFYEREILIRICRGDFKFFSEKAIFYYRDIYDHITKFYEMVEINRETIAHLLELYLACQNTRMAKISNQINEVMKRLTLITTIFMPLTLLSGIGGMSEWSMITGPENWKISYPIFFLLMGLIAVVNYLLLKWKNWV